LGIDWVLDIGDWDLKVFEFGACLYFDA